MSKTVDNDCARGARHDTWRDPTHERAYADRAPIAPITAERVLVRRNPTCRAAPMGQSVCRLGGAVGLRECYPMGLILAPRIGTWPVNVHSVDSSP